MKKYSKRLHEWLMQNNKVIQVLCLITITTCLCFKSSGCGFDREFATGLRMLLSNNVVRVYYLKLPENYNSKTSYPLIFAFHGLFGDYTNFSDGLYDLQSVVGDEAILVYPNALKDDSGVPGWNSADLNFFDDLYRELESNLSFDAGKVFAVGHSNGGFFAHVLGCQRGDLLRAIAPVAGYFPDYINCGGQVAILQIHGWNDEGIPLQTGWSALKNWVEINNCTKEETNEVVNLFCESFGECDTGFPVHYCVHDEGHRWPGFASDTIWTFFKSLPSTIPSG